jgi:hypothetical protein
METLACTYVFEPREFRWVLLDFYRNRLRLLFLVGFVVMFSLVFISDLSSHLSAHDLTGKIALASALTNLAGVLFWFAVFLPLMFLFQCWTFRGTPLFKKQMNYLLSEIDVKLDAGEMKIDLTWNAWTFANETSRGFVLYMGRAKRNFYWLPRHGFASQESYEKCRELIRTKVASVKLLR